MKNDYEVRGDVTALFIKREDGSIIETLIDTLDLERVRAYSGTWRAVWMKNRNICYVFGDRSVRNAGRPLLHRWIMRPPKYWIVKHLNRNGLDNRRSNLQVTKRSGRK